MTRPRIGLLRTITSSASSGINPPRRTLSHAHERINVMPKPPTLLCPRLAMLLALGCAWLGIGPAAHAGADVAKQVPPVSERFADVETKEVPDFQKHVMPVLGRLGCNGRACHGSFQGAGGFRLSLFGYDFKADHNALLLKDSQRVVTDDPDGSKIIQKPTLGIPHKGGKRLEPDSWAHHLLSRWIESGAQGTTEPVALVKLEVMPRELSFTQPGQSVQLSVKAHWTDGSIEDVTCISRFRTNDESIAEIDESGKVTSKGKGDTHVVAFYDKGVEVSQVILPVSDRLGPHYPDTPTRTTVDRLVADKLRKLGIVSSDVCSDTDFLRRVSLDLTGTLPTPAEVESFLSDSHPDKRSKLVDDLMTRPSYAAWWATKLCDLTGNSARYFQGQFNNNEISKNWYAWILRRLADNVGYDKIIEGIVLGASRKPGESYDDFIQRESAFYREKDPADFTANPTMPYYWARRTVTKPEDRALNFSYAFLGVRLECAQCHKHPFDQWSQDDFNRFTSFFNNVRYGRAPDAAKRMKELEESLELKGKNNAQQRQILTAQIRQGKPIPAQEVFVLPTVNRERVKGKAAKQSSPALKGVEPRVLGGPPVDLSRYEDPRQPLMDWMRSKDNPFFAKSIVNRIWAYYFKVGIINPPDDMNLANPPSNQPLLDHLVKGFIEHQFDLRWLHHEILTSDTYQRSWKTNETNRLDERNFSHALVRRLPAEVASDALAQATAKSELLAQAHSSVANRAIGANSGLIGRNGDYSAKVFGKPTRDTNCDCNRSDDPTLLQAIYLQNDQEVLTLIERGDGWVVENAQSRKAEAAAKNLKKSDSQAALQAVENRIERVTKQLDRAKKKDLKEEIPTLTKSLVDLRQEAGKLRQRVATETKTPQTRVMTFAPEKVDTLIQQAYLRTLSRYPTSQEQAVAKNYFTDTQDGVTGLRDLLWALVNTKEFITNH